MRPSFSSRNHRKMLQPQNPVNGRLRDVPFLVLVVLVLVLSIALLYSGSQAGQGEGKQSSEVSEQGGALSRVRVDFYGESLCPDCRHMVLDVLKPMVEGGFADVMDLRYIAYGKVRSVGGELQCQHGELECLYNRYINCAQEEGDISKWMGYVECLAKDLGKLRAGTIVDECASSHGLSADALQKCAEGDRGAMLEADAGKKTTSLNPKLNFVPWIVVNGAPIGADFENLDRYVCVSLAEDARPKACSSLPRGLGHQ